MSGKYKAYPAYKDAKLEWIDSIPKNWSLAPLKYMALEKDSLFLDGDWIESKDISDNGIRYITTGNVGEGQYKEQGAGFITDEKFIKLGCTEVFPGDVLISRLNNPIGRACVVPDLHSRIVTSVDNVIFRPDGSYFKQYLVYLFSSKDYFKHTSELARGATMQRISRGLLGNIRLMVPSYEEQKAIANFLNHETTKIDTLIEEQKTLIRLLQEKRQAVISHAVTKGLNPDAPMKYFGVEWLGEVPEHWEILPLKYAVTFQRGHDLPSDKRVEGNVPLVTSAGVSACHNVAIAQGPGLVTGRYGTIGDFTLVWEDYWPLNTTLYSIDLRDNNPKYLWYMLQNLKPIFLANSLKSAVPGVDRNDLHPVLVAVVKDHLEQSEICEYLDNMCTKYDRLTNEATEAIRLLQERRTALISAAVTGKIDVRDWTPPAPQQEQ